MIKKTIRDKVPLVQEINLEIEREVEREEIEISDYDHDILEIECGVKPIEWKIGEPNKGKQNCDKTN